MWGITHFRGNFCIFKIPSDIYLLILLIVSLVRLSTFPSHINVLLILACAEILELLLEYFVYTVAYVG